MSDTQTTITTEGELITLITTFTCAAELQNALVNALDRAAADVFVSQPGFISANIHASLDRTRVVSYAQWASREAFERMAQRPEVQDHMDRIMKLAESADPRLFTVRAIRHA